LIDTLGCVAQGSIEVAQPSELTLTLTTNPAIDNNGGNASAYASGGVPPYQLYWSTGAEGLSQDNLPAGTYTILLSDANGCELNVDFVIGQEYTIGLNDLSKVFALPYPNPGDGKILIDSKLCAIITGYRVFSLHGQLLASSSISPENNCTLHLELLASGT
jgi:hypothetical protein